MKTDSKSVSEPLKRVGGTGPKEGSEGGRTSLRAHSRRVQGWSIAVAAIALVTAGAAPPIGEPGPMWNNAGHQIVCHIAWLRLTDTAREQVRELIAADPDYTEFAPSCVWADEIRAQIRLGVESLQHLDRYTPAHYVNTPRGRSGVDPNTCTRYFADRAPSMCVLDGIEEVSESLSHYVDVEVRLQALKFLGHFVGDVHQPLHAGYGDDRGGNDFEVSMMGLSGRNLHGVWDAFFLQHGGVPWEELANALADRITPIDARLWASTDPVVWADESYQIVEREVYQGLEPDGAYIGQAYYDRHIATVERQLMKAGVRLALVLNERLDPSAGS